MEVSAACLTKFCCQISIKLNFKQAQAVYIFLQIFFNQKRYPKIRLVTQEDQTKRLKSILAQANALII